MEFMYTTAYIMSMEEVEACDDVHACLPALLVPSATQTNRMCMRCKLRSLHCCACHTGFPYTKAYIVSVKEVETLDNTQSYLSTQVVPAQGSSVQPF